MTDSPLEVPIKQLWLDLGGELPKAGNYVKAFWRQSDSANIQLLPEKNKYIDHARGDIGGPVKLVKTVLDKSGREAVKYLHQHYGNGIVPQQPRYDKAELLRVSNFRLGMIEYCDAKLAELSAAKGSSDRAMLTRLYTEARMSMDGLADVNGRLRDVPQAIAEYKRWAEKMPELTEYAVQLGREQRIWARRVGELALSAPQQERGMGYGN